MRNIKRDDMEGLMMRKNISLIVMIFSAVLIFSACSSNSTLIEKDTPPAEDYQVGQNSEDTASNEVEGNDVSLPNDSGSEIGGTRLAGSLYTVAELEGGLDIGASQEEVAIFFDSHPYQEVTSSFDGKVTWRYDIGAQADYSFESETDLHDQEGILNGDVPLQIFIYFDEEGNVSGYSAYQAGAEGSINVYQTLGDGTRKLDTIK
jgi:hypothetical protein